MPWLKVKLYIRRLPSMVRNNRLDGSHLGDKGKGYQDVLFSTVNLWATINNIYSSWLIVLHKMMNNIYSISKLVQFRNTLCVPFYKRFHIIRWFEYNVELWAPVMVMVSHSSARGAQRLHTLYNVMMKSAIPKNSRKTLKLHKMAFEWTYMQEATLWYGRNDEKQAYKSFQSCIGNNC